MFKENLSKIVKRVDLNEEQMSQMITEIFSGNITDAQIGAMMAALATKGETFEELAGAARAMRRKALRIQTSTATVVDTCGTGGDGAHTFNISTTTSFVVAACGVTVAKHGNRSVSSQCGSADLLEALGVKLDTAPEIVEEAVQDIGIGFLFAPLYHGAMRFAAKARKEVGLRPNSRKCLPMPFSYLVQKERLWFMVMMDWMKFLSVLPPEFQNSKTVLFERMIYLPNSILANWQIRQIFWAEIPKKTPKLPVTF
jgi:anthranilate phosphoribosyltransferase